MLMLFGCFVSLLVCAVFLGTFVTESGVFGETKCDNSTTNATLCFESYNKIKGLSAATLIFLILSCLSNIFGLIDRNPKNEKLKAGSQGLLLYYRYVTRHFLRGRVLNMFMSLTTGRHDRMVVRFTNKLKLGVRTPVVHIMRVQDL